MQAGSKPSLAVALQVAPSATEGPAVAELLPVQARWRTADEQALMVEALLRRPVLEQAAWEALPVDEQVGHAVLLQQAARRRQEAMQGIDRGDAGFLSRASVQLALDSLQTIKGSSAVQQEEQLLGELLELISSDQQ